MDTEPAGKRNSMEKLDRALSEVAGLVFDLDDTLVDFGSKYEHRLKVARHRRAQFRDRTPEEVAAVLERVGAEFWREHSDLGPFRARYEGRREITRRAMRFLGLIELSEDADFVESFTSEYVLLREASGVLRPGAEMVLSELRTRGFKLGLLTNGATEIQRPKIDRLNLSRLFDCVQIEEVEGVAKPDAAAFRNICDKLGLLPAACCMIGDNYALDMVGAKRAGLKAIHFRQTVPEEEHAIADASIRDIQELLSIFAGGRC